MGWDVIGPGGCESKSEEERENDRDDSEDAKSDSLSRSMSVIPDTDVVEELD